MPLLVRWIGRKRGFRAFFRGGKSFRLAATASPNHYFPPCELNPSAIKAFASAVTYRYVVVERYVVFAAVGVHCPDIDAGANADRAVVAAAVDLCPADFYSGIHYSTIGCL